MQTNVREASAMIAGQQLNEVYSRLEAKHSELVWGLTHRIFELESGWYSGHYQKREDGTWVRDAYPIPVISVKGLCDIEIQLDRINVTTKLKRSAALAYSYQKLMGYEWEAYGMENYLSEYYHAGQSVEELKDNIRASREKEVGFSFTFPFETDGKQFLEFAKLLRREGFYY